MKSVRPPSNTATHNQLRIIGGIWRGRKLSFPTVEGLRPTGDRIRETLFNWLAPEIQNARCLDLFSGSGALGFETLSRGAAFTTMVERDNKAATQLRDNLKLLFSNQENNMSEKGNIIHSDALSFLQQKNSEAPYHIVFIDPPFQQNLWQNVIEKLETGNWLAEDASIYIESSLDAIYHAPINWQLHRDKKAGQVTYKLFYRAQIF